MSIGNLIEWQHYRAEKYNTEDVLEDRQEAQRRVA